MISSHINEDDLLDELKERKTSVWKGEGEHDNPRLYRKPADEGEIRGEVWLNAFAFGAPFQVKHSHVGKC